MQFLKTILAQQPMVALLLNTPIGYLFGKINIGALIRKPRIATGEPSLKQLEIAISNQEAIGKKLNEVRKALPADVQITEVRENHRDRFASPEIILTERSVLLAVSSSKESLEQARAHLGKTPETAETCGPTARPQRCVV